MVAQMILLMSHRMKEENKKKNDKFSFTKFTFSLTKKKINNLHIIKIYPHDNLSFYCTCQQFNIRIM